jgi:hypothetical protein
MKTKELTWREIAKKWRSGETVASAELGGIGPAYEQAIQILLMEIMARWPKTKRVPKPEGKALPLAFEKHSDKVADELNKRLGFSEAQVAVARVTAYQFMHFGYSEMMKTLPVDRKIFVSKSFPSLAP